MATEIYFIDTKLENYQTIIDSLSSTDKYYLIDSSSDGLTQISNVLSNYSNLDSIHVYSHGDVGSLNIGNSIYDNTNILNYKIELENIGKSLSSTGDILLYGCNVGQDEVGKNFINQIAQYTQADVAASDDLTGNKVLGGDWDLEVKSGVVETEAKMSINYELTFGTITATSLINGQIVNFDKTSSDNYYSFTLNSAGKVLMSGTDGIGGSINLDIYDSNFNKVDYFSSLNGSGTTVSLLSGTYYIHAIDDTNGGKFYIASNKISGGTIPATPLINGQIVNFDKTSWDNHYSFTLNSAGKVLISGTDGIGGSINLDIYDSNFNKVDYFSSLNGSGTTVSLLSGTYYIHAIDDTNGGKFYIASNKISGGTIPATPLINGQIVNFDKTSWDNHYSFTLNSAGKVLISGTDGIGGSINLDIYDSNFNKVDYFSSLNGSGTTVSLLSGTYYIHAIDDTNGGKFYIASNKISGGTIPATPLINGQIVNFDKTSWDNHYSFTLNSAGKVLISGTDGIGGSINLDIYDSNFNKVDYFSSLNGSGTTVSLLSGTYYIHAIDDTNGGKFYIASNKISGGTIPATPLINGQIVNFDKTSWDNHYSFTLNSAGKVLISGTDGIGGSINLDIYDSNFNKVDYFSSLNGSGTTVSLLSGTYYIHAIDDTNGGSFYVNFNTTTPTIISVTTGTVTENAVTSTVIYKVTATDADANTTLAYSLSGTDASLLNINSSTGNVTLKSSANYEAKNKYSFNVIASDGTLTATKAVVVNVTNVNEFAPTSINKTITINEDTAKVLTLSDFAFSDADANSSLSKVKITQLETKGTLKLNGVDVILNQEILASDIKANKLTFTPISNEFGTSYSNFKFQVSDGTKYSTSSYTTTFNVTQVIDTVSKSTSYTLPSLIENLTLIGTSAINGTGNTLNNVITGNSANNVLDGKIGIDTMKGGLGNDTYIVDNVKDIVTELASQGTDTINSSVTYTLSSNVENLSLLGTSVINGIGNSLNNVITGNTAANTLNGGLGKDVFVFNTKLGSTNVDKITDFNITDDTIKLENSIFAKLTTLGTLNKDYFKANLTGKAIDINDYLVYETDTGKLFYDADGSGTTISAIQIALIENKAALTYADFTVI